MNDTAPGRRHVTALITVRMTSASGYFALLPFLGLWLVDEQHLSGSGAGVVVAATIVGTRCGGLLLVPAIRKMGLRRSVLVAYRMAGVLLAGSGAATPLSMAAWLPIFFALGLCLAAATTAIKALVAAAYPEQRQLHGFTYLNVAVNAGSALGPVFGGAVIAFRPALLPLVGCVSFVVSAASSFWLPVARYAERPAPRPSRSRNPIPGAFILFVLPTMGTWLAYAQVFTVLPVFLAPRIDPSRLGWVFTLNAVLVIALQVPVSSLLGRVAPHLRGLVGNFGMALSVVLFGLGASLGVSGVVVAMVVFTVAELIWSPLYDTEVNVRRGTLSSALAFGAAGVLWGGAEAAGAWLGNTIVVATGSALPYWIAGACAAISGITIAITGRRARPPRRDGALMLTGAAGEPIQQE
jgi:MFS family permease